MKKLCRILLFLTVLLCLLTGCNEEEPRILPDLEAGVYGIYYKNHTETKLVVESYQAAAGKSDRDELIDELLTQVFSRPENGELQTCLPETVRFIQFRMEGAILYLYFDSSYGLMEPVEEILCRAAVVKTLTQIEDVEYISFYVGDQPLMDAAGNPVEIMTAADFSDTTGDMVNSYQRASLTLYFANEQGDCLVETNLEVLYTSNISMERLVVEQLIHGPSVAGAYPTLSPDIKLLGVSVTDNICYVKLDSEFLTQQLAVNDYIPVYSIVNSLSELPNINKVQILVNGSKDYVFREAIPLNSPFERNLNYVGD